MDKVYAWVVKHQNPIIHAGVVIVVALLILDIINRRGG